MRTILTAVLAMLAGAGPAANINGSAAGRIAPGWPVELRVPGRVVAPADAQVEVRDEQQIAVALDWKQAGPGARWVLAPEATREMKPGRYQVALTVDGKRTAAALEVMMPPFEADDDYLSEQIRAYTRYERATGQTQLASRREQPWRAARAYPNRNPACAR